MLEVAEASVDAAAVVEADAVVLSVEAEVLAAVVLLADESVVVALPDVDVALVGAWPNSGMPPIPRIPPIGPIPPMPPIPRIIMGFII